ncbi:MAG: Crp/Fnr family transcriptional regulator [Rikenellaceae bacterium]
MNNLDFNFFCSSCTKDDAYREANCFTKYRIKRYRAGEYITYMGDPARELSIVATGSVITELVLDSGVVYTSVPHSAPYPIGAIALFSKENRYRADIKAYDDCEVIAVARDDVEDQLAECRIFMRNFIAYTTQKIDLFTDHINVLTQINLKAKLAFYIFSMSKDGTFIFDKKLEPLATYLCVERPSLSRALSELVKDGVISYRRGEGEIIDRMALKSLLD